MLGFKRDANFGLPGESHVTLRSTPTSSRLALWDLLYITQHPLLNPSETDVDSITLLLLYIITSHCCASLPNAKKCTHCIRVCRDGPWQNNCQPGPESSLVRFTKQVVLCTNAAMRPLRWGRSWKGRVAMLLVSTSFKHLLQNPNPNCFPDMDLKRMRREGLCCWACTLSSHSHKNTTALCQIRPKPTCHMDPRAQISLQHRGGGGMKDIQPRTVLGQGFYEGKGVSFSLPAWKWKKPDNKLTDHVFLSPNTLLFTLFCCFDRLYNAARFWNKLHCTGRVEPTTAFYCDPREENRSV